jgi:transcriptional regulator with XRE-family HTH domain
MLRWEQFDIAAAAGVSVETIKRLERSDGPLQSTRVATVVAIQRAFEVAGIEFIPENGGGAGVRLRHPRSQVDAGKRPKAPASDDEA